MTYLRKYSAAIITILAAIFVASPLPAAEPKVLAQSPCNGDAGGVCVTLDQTGPTGSTLRTYSFTTPGDGKALVQFDGTATCVNFNTTANVPMIFDTQIVTAPDANPHGTGPGGARFSQRVSLQAGTAGGSTLNLHSSRVININAAGRQRVYLRLKFLVTNSVSCDFYQNRFTVLFFPKP